MKNTWKFFFSAVTIAAYMLIASSTSMDKNYNFIEGLVVNASDSCDITALKFIHTVTPTNDDTLFVYQQVVPPGDTAFIVTDSLPFHTLNYLCSCPNDTAYFREQPFVFGINASPFPAIDAGCD